MKRYNGWEITEEPGGPLVYLEDARAELGPGNVSAERARIRQLALARAERWLADGSEFAAQALRELADELGER